MNKITVIGSGNVGSTIAYTLTIMGIASEIVMIDVNEEKSLGEAKGLYNIITDTFGGISNIESVNVNGSRLSLVLKDTTYINHETLKVMSDMGFGVVKTSKKITLVVGEMATHYYNEIQKQMEK